MPASVIVLGAGMVGSVIGADLAAAGLDIADISESALAVATKRSQGALKTVVADLSKDDVIVDVISGFDILMCAVPGFMGFKTLQTAIGSGKVKLMCDISFMPEDARGLEALAKEKGVCLVVDMGIAPGVMHALVGHSSTLMKDGFCQNIELYVGGLPRLREWPFEYKAPFSPTDVVEEYTRPSYVIEHGAVTEHPALSGVVKMDMPGVGTVEAFYSDGLRSLLRTVKADTMFEKTFRYPGQPEFLRALRHIGLFSGEPVTVRDAKTGQMVSVRPRDVVESLLFPMWHYKEGEVDILILKAIVEGTCVKTGKPIREVWTLYDELDPKTNFPSMSRTTGFPAAIAVRMLADGKFAGRTGVVFPEQIGMDDELFARLVRELGERGVNLVHVE